MENEPLRPPEISPAIIESFTIDEGGVTPIWLQIRNRLLYLMTSGKFKEGDQLPSMRQLSVQLQVNLNTVSKVYQNLQQDGFIASKRGKGFYVADLSKANAAAADFAGRALAEEFIWRCRSGGLSSEEIVELVRCTIDEIDGRA